eukprot:2421894-Alexandrium_andersonii.AAC.1
MLLAFLGAMRVLPMVEQLARPWATCCRRSSWRPRLSIRFSTARRPPFARQAEVDAWGQQ